MVTKKLEEVGDGLFAYTQLPGTWGWSNAGLIHDGDQCLLVDTLFDRKLTAEMLETMRSAVPAAERIGTVVNTHGNGDHCYGNGLVSDATIIATEGCVKDLADAPPSRNQQLLRAGGVMMRLGGAGRLLGKVFGAVGLDLVPWLVDAAPLAVPLFADFDFANNDVVLPNQTFSDRLELTVGDKRVELLELGPAHTLGDAVVYVPDDRVVFTGDLLFQDAHPIVWEGPVSNWIAACDRLLALDVDTVVPGHGPITDKTGVQALKDYLQFLTAEARARYDAGLSADDCVKDLVLDAYAGWLDAERVIVNVRTLYRDFAGGGDPPHVLSLFAAMAKYREGRL